MALTNIASNASVWRGYEYYKEKKVKSCLKTGESSFEGRVAGSSEYAVTIDIEHPRSSRCNCPHAQGRRIICKHMIALYFEAFPEAAQKYYNDVVEAEENEEIRRDKLERALINHLSKMKKTELQDALFMLLMDGPEWQYERFLRDHIDEYWD